MFIYIYVFSVYTQVDKIMCIFTFYVFYVHFLILIHINRNIYKMVYSNAHSHQNGRVPLSPHLLSALNLIPYLIILPICCFKNVISCYFVCISLYFSEVEHLSPIYWPVTSLSLLTVHILCRKHRCCAHRVSINTSWMNK